jgi:drug/metabolite transporter (DMT)-like permease
MCAGVAMFPFMSAAQKLLAGHYPVAEIVWARFTGHLVVMLLVFLPRYRWRLLATRRPAVQIARSLLMLASNALYVVAIARVPLATASAIGFTSPLLVTALSVPLLHESVGIRRWSAVIVGFAGALLIIRPGSGLRDPAVLLLLLGSTPTRSTRSPPAGSPSTTPRRPASSSPPCSARSRPVSCCRSFS